MPHPPQVREELTPNHILQNKEKIPRVLEIIMQIHNERVLQPCQDGFFIQYMLDLLSLNNSSLAQHLDRINRPPRTVSGKAYATKGTSAQSRAEIEFCEGGGGALLYLLSVCVCGFGLGCRRGLWWWW